VKQRGEGDTMSIVRETPIPCPLGDWCSNGDCRVGTERRARLCVEENVLRAERIALDWWRDAMGLSPWPPEKAVPAGGNGGSWPLSKGDWCELS
jgi:hypothetical protein